MFEDVADDELIELLSDDPSWTLFPPAADREAWDRVLAVPWRQAQADRYVAMAEELMSEPVAVLRATDYLEVHRTGDRHAYERPYFDRRTRLAVTALAEAAEHRGRFTDEVVDLMWMICDEATWCLPSHLEATVPKAERSPLPRHRQTVDIFASQTAFLLAMVTQLLREELDTVSPVVVGRTHDLIRERVVGPFLEHEADWWWLDQGMNWNPWCVSNVLGATLCSPTDAATAARIVRRATESLRHYLDAQPADGGIDEGPSYWNVGVGCVAIALEVLHARTSGALDGFDDATLSACATYPHRMHLGGGQLPPFGDARFRTRIDAGMAHRLGTRCDVAELCRLALLGTKGFCHDAEPRLELDRLTMNAYCTTILFDWFWLPDDTTTGPRDQPPVDGFEDLGVWLLRSSPNEGRGFTVAVKGGHNAEMHGHHDVGEVMVLHDSEPLIVDVGTAVYRGDDFGPNGGEIWYRRGRGHNLPVVNGHEQRPGEQARAELLELDTSGGELTVRLDVTTAYPSGARVRRAERRVTLDRSGPALRIVDTAERKGRGIESAISFLTPAEPRVVDPGVVELGDVVLTVAADGDDPVTLAVEPVDIGDDPIMTQAFGDRLHRVVVTASGRGSSLTTTVEIHPRPGRD